jgi:hypothetical protein
MKRCPTCKRIFSDANLSFCTDDGTPLVKVVDESARETLLYPSGSDAAPADGSPPSGDRVQPEYQPPGSYAPPPNQPARRRVWLWVVATLAIVLVAVAALGIVAAVFIPRMLRAAANENSNTDVRSYRRDNENVANTNPNANSNVNSGEDNENDNTDSESLSPAPNSEEEVLAQLTDLENEWTVANINADKKKLDRILADDYVGNTGEGKPHGKAEYLKTIEPDKTIQKWNFEDLKVRLIGERATLTGIIRLEVKDQEVAFNFVDKFVWRDGRWQATGSEVTPIKQ